MIGPPTVSEVVPLPPRRVPFARHAAAQWHRCHTSREQYRERYASERPETFDAYVDVWKRSSSAHTDSSGWALLSQCANGEHAKAREMPSRIRKAERIMTDAGYRIGRTTKRGARRWIKSTP